MEIKQILNNIGDKISEFTQNAVTYIASFGLNINPTIAKLISLFVLLGLSFILIKFLEKPIKYALAIISFILAIAVAFSILG